MTETMWKNSPITLYHGTLMSHARDISANGVNLRKCKSRGDFSQGFYTTSSRAQAVAFANRKFENTRFGDRATHEAAAVLSWTVERVSLGRLENLTFVRGRHNDEFWQFVNHCWELPVGHKAGGGFYDVVYGPLNLNRLRHHILPDSDQISFHTQPSLQILQASRCAQEIGSRSIAV
jgi:hypothetical protein